MLRYFSTDLKIPAQQELEVDPTSWPSSQGHPRHTSQQVKHIWHIRPHIGSQVALGLAHHPVLGGFVPRFSHQTVYFGHHSVLVYIHELQFCLWLRRASLFRWTMSLLTNPCLADRPLGRLHPTAAGMTALPTKKKPWISLYTGLCAHVWAEP